MVDLLMLGIVPGTNIQIDFETWLRCTILLAGCIMLFSLFRRRTITAMLVTIAIYRMQRRYRANNEC